MSVNSLKIFVFMRIKAKIIVENILKLIDERNDCNESQSDR